MLPGILGAGSPQRLKLPGKHSIRNNLYTYTTLLHIHECQYWMDFTHTWAELGETVVVVSQSSVIYKIPSLQQGRAELSSRQYSTEQTRAEKERWEIRRSGVWNVIYIVWDISSCEVWIKIQLKWSLRTPYSLSHTPNPTTPKPQRSRLYSGGESLRSYLL